jgi:hypothetical protein
MNNTTIERLTKLADYLRVLPAGRWSYYDGSWNGEGHPVGCALVHAADVFPELVRNGEGWTEDRDVGLTDTYLAHFFGLDEGEARNLFEPKDSGLGESATASQVADHISEFVDQLRSHQQ